MEKPKLINLINSFMREWEIDEDLFYKQETLRDKIVFLLNYAVLAPSTHNSQPWLFKISDDSCKIYANPDLYLKEADKDGRDLFISIGCLIENLVIASQYFSVYKNIVYSNNLQIISNNIEGNDYFIAEIFFDNNNNSSNGRFIRLFNAIKKRFNARGIFLDRQLEKELIDSFKSLNDFIEVKLSLVMDNKKKEKIANLTSNGMRLAHQDKNFRKELSAWINNLFSPKKDGMTWKSMRAPFFVSFCVSHLIRIFNLGTILSKLNYKSVLSAPLICVMSSEDNVMSWINVGRIAERIMLNAYLNELKTAIFVAAIESKDLRNKLRNLIDIQSLPQFLICVGYMDINPIHTPRHSVESKIKKNKLQGA